MFAQDYPPKGLKNKMLITLTGGHLVYYINPPGVFIMKKEESEENTALLTEKYALLPEDGKRYIKALFRALIALQRSVPGGEKKAQDEEK
jgi:hypothetical protein